MKCNQECEQGRHCDCDEDMYSIDVWMIWAAWLGLTVLLTAVTFAVGGFLWGMFA